MSKTRWQVILHRKAERVLKRLAGDLLERIRRAIRGLASEPRLPGYKKLTGVEKLYRTRVGDWRIIYAIEDEQLIVLVLETSSRVGAYRNL